VAWPKYVSALAVLRAQVLLRYARADFGALPRLRGKVTVTNHGRLVAGARLLVDSRSFRTQINVGPGAHLVLGDDVFINQGADIWAARSIRIGDRVMLGPHVTVADDGAHDIAPDVPRRVAPVVIESDAWLGRRAIVMPGVTIGRFAVVGAGSVVTGDVPPCTVVAGVPARVVRTFDQPPDTFRR
jgi:acetyltransferase-like isoleucine patch superfamily enzyme